MEVNLETQPIGEDAPELVNVVVEVPVGNRNKYESELGVCVRDRVPPGNTRFPADHGFVPSTAGAAGVPLGTGSTAYEPGFPGCVVRARAVGALEVVEGGSTEYNVFAVPDNPRFDDIRTLEDLPDQNRREVEQFFVTFKQLEGDEEAEVRGWCDLEEARAIVRKSAR